MDDLAHLTVEQKLLADSQRAADCIAVRPCELPLTTCAHRHAWLPDRADAAKVCDCPLTSRANIAPHRPWRRLQQPTFGGIGQPSERSWRSCSLLAAERRRRCSPDL